MRDGARWRAPLAMVALVALIAAACDGGDDDAADAADAAPQGSVRMAAINVLHGIFCPEDTDYCAAPERLELLWTQIEGAGCPDLVGFSEIGPRHQDLVPERLGDLCDGRYTLLWDPEEQGQELDQEMILTSLEVVDDAYVDLANFPWGAHWVRVDSPLGLIDFTTTHFASSGFDVPCTREECPPICAEGLPTGACHSLQLLDFLDGLAAPDVIQVISNDLNDTIGSDRLASIVEAGFVDAWLEAGLPECDPATGEHCTCCISSEVDDHDGGGLDDPTLRRSTRIDFVLVRGTERCRPDFDAGTTALIGGDPFEEPIGGVYWPSDHAGIVTTLTCS